MESWAGDLDLKAVTAPEVMILRICSSESLGPGHWVAISKAGWIGNLDTGTLHPLSGSFLSVKKGPACPHEFLLVQIVWVSDPLSAVTWAETHHLGLRVSRDLH